MASLSQISETKVSNRGFASIPTTGKKNVIAPLIITALAMFAIDPATDTLFGLPRNFVISLIPLPYFLFMIRGRIGFKYVQFALAYLAGFLPATISQIDDLASIKWTSVIQLLAMLVDFCVLGSYFEAWLARNSDKVKLKMITRILLYFFVLSIVELIFYHQFFNLRILLHGQSAAVLNDTGMQRELSLYGGRPSALFSEPSNFAKYVSLIVAAYMVISKRSRRSIVTMVAFLLLIRSVSYFYAAPVMVIAFLQPNADRKPSKGKRRGKLDPKRILILVAIGALLAGIVTVTQWDRIKKGLTGNDNSTNARLMLPLKYMASNSGKILTGYGITPQAKMDTFVRVAVDIATNQLSDSGTRQALSTSLVIFAGMGLLGLLTFFVAMFLMYQMQGVLLTAIFLFSNLLNSGYNGSTTWVLSALLMSLAIYQSSLARRQVAAVESIPGKLVTRRPAFQR